MISNGDINIVSASPSMLGLSFSCVTSGFILKSSIMKLGGLIRVPEMSMHDTDASLIHLTSLPSVCQTTSIKIIWY